MISPMKKYTFLVYHREYEEFLKNIGNLGVLHITEPVEKTQNETLLKRTEQLGQYEKSIEILKEFSASPVQENKSVSFNPEGIILRLEELLKERSGLEETKTEISSKIEKSVPWGDYDPEDIKRFEDVGYQVQLYRCPESHFKTEWETKYELFTINKLQGNHYFLVISNNEEIDIEAEKEDIPSFSNSSLNEKHEDVISSLIEIESELSVLASSIEILDKRRQSLEDEINMISVMLDTKTVSDNKLMMLEGWVPEASEKNLVNYLNKNEVVNFEAAPEENDSPPILLKNRKYSKLFEPIGELYNLPAYNEMDLTPYFAPFFMIFFGFCLGDAGYGVFLILFASILKLKMKKEMKPILSLTQYLGVATVLFGVVSGTFFGINLIDSGYILTSSSLKVLADGNLPMDVLNGLKSLEGEYFKTKSQFVSAIKQNIDSNYFNQFKIEILKQSRPGAGFLTSIRHLMLEPLNMFYLSLMIGGLQILFGFLVKIFNVSKQLGFKHSISTIGWFILLVVLVIFMGGDKMNILSLESTKYLFYALMGVSGILIFFFNNPDKNIFVRFGSGIWDTYGVVIGLFGDLLSYIRLFALGISSAILGFVFNDISLQFLEIPYIGWLFFLILLLIGHSINLFLAALGGFIHPMRLTFVEFYKNAGFQGGGKKYKPFIINK